MFLYRVRITKCHFLAYTVFLESVRNIPLGGGVKILKWSKYWSFQEEWNQKTQYFQGKNYDFRWFFKSVFKLFKMVSMVIRDVSLTRKRCFKLQNGDFSLPSPRFAQNTPKIDLERIFNFTSKMLHNYWVSTWTLLVASQFGVVESTAHTPRLWKRIPSLINVF